MKKRIFKAVLWAAIEDYTKLLHLLPDIYNDINDKYDINLSIAKKVLLFYIENDYISLFYENWKIPNKFIKIPKKKALKLVIETSAWERPNDDLWVVISASPKGEDLYYSGKIDDDSFILPDILQEIL